MIGDPEIIYLSPACDDCVKGNWDRAWCEDDVWEKCEKRQQRSVKFVRADLVEKMET